MQRKLITYLILTSYLALFLANIFHFHHLKLNNYNLNEVSEQNKNIYSTIEHSSIQCPVHNTFNNLHFSYLSSKLQAINIFTSREKFSLKSFDFFQSLFFYNTFGLRAPPTYLS